MKRPYKDPWPIEKAFEEIKNCSGSHFDPHFVDCFLEIEDEIRKIKADWDKKE